MFFKFLKIHRPVIQSGWQAETIIHQRILSGNLHSDIDTLERAEIIRDMRLDVFDVLVGINLLREGLDIPEISLVAILDADKEGFLRSETSLIQTIGRAARNAEGRVILSLSSAAASKFKSAAACFICFCIFAISFPSSSHACGHYRNE